MPSKRYTGLGSTNLPLTLPAKLFSLYTVHEMPSKRYTGLGSTNLPLTLPAKLFSLYTVHEMMICEPVGLQRFKIKNIYYYYIFNRDAIFLSEKISTGSG